MHYLGDAVIHMSFPLLLWSTPAWHPLLLLGPLTNYRFLRKMGGDIENEASQEERYKEAGEGQKLQDLQTYREEKNSFWPLLREIGNKSLWKDIGIGAILVMVIESERRL